MSFLYFLAEHRCAFLTFVMSVITYIGDEIGFLIIALFIYWCKDKDRAYYIFALAFSGILFNQCIKMSARVERPWIKDRSFSAVESAKKAATGYSFPSGHTQNAVGTLCGVALTSKVKATKIIFPILAVLVAISRMYLGVHTPADVLFSVALAVLLLFAMKYVFDYCRGNFTRMNIVFASLVLLSIFATIYIFTMTGSEMTGDALSYFLENQADAKKNAVVMLACALGMWCIYLIDVLYTHFDVRGTHVMQTVKFVVGMALMLALKSGLKVILGTSYPATFIRYFLLIIIGGGIYPMFFGKMQKLFRYGKQTEGGADKAERKEA